MLAAHLSVAFPGWEQGLDALVEALDQPVVGPTLQAMRRELSSGLHPEELELALRLREFWSESETFGMSWHHYRSGWVSRNDWETLSWPLALRLVRSFDGIPEVEEIELFLMDQFDHWRRQPPYVNSYSFSGYLYALTSGDGTCLEWRFRTS